MISTLKLKEKFLTHPKETKKLAKEFGFWDELKATLEFPVLKTACQKDVNVFGEYILADNETGEPIKQQDFHKEWQVMFQRNKFTLIGAPRGHGKTIQVVLFIIWSLGNNPNLRIKIIGATDPKSEEIFALVKEYIQQNEKVRQIFPNLVVDPLKKNTKNQFFLRRKVPGRDPSLECAGVLTAGAGGRADILICDDICDFSNSVGSPETREKIKQAIKEVWFSLVSSTGRVIWVCTPYHKADATHDLKDAKDTIFDVWWQPAIQYVIQYDENGQPLEDEAGRPITKKILLWPDKWGEEQLESKRRSLNNDRVFARQYLLQTMSDEERTFSEEIIKMCQDPNIIDIGEIAAGERIPDYWPTYAGIDVASSMSKNKSKKSAFCVIFIFARNPETGKLYPKEVWRKKAMFPDFVKNIVALFEKHKWYMAYVETNATQLMLKEHLDDIAAHIPLEPFQTGTNKIDPEIGLAGMASVMGKKHIVLPAADYPYAKDDQRAIGLLYDELENHPNSDYQDIIMAMWFAWRASQLGNKNFEEGYLQALEEAV